MSISPAALLASFAKPPTVTRLFEQALYQGATHLNLNVREMRRDFERLNVRQWGLPTGVYDWKLWRSEHAPGCWWLHGFVPHDETHSRHACLPVFMLPNGAEVCLEPWRRPADGIEQHAVLLRHRGRELYYGSGGVRQGLIQYDAWGIESGTL